MQCGTFSTDLEATELAPSLPKGGCKSAAVERAIPRTQLRHAVFELLSAEEKRRCCAA